MKALTYTALRGNLAKTMREVCDDHDPVIITRKQHDAVVIKSIRGQVCC